VLVIVPSEVVLVIERSEKIASLDSKVAHEHLRWATEHEEFYTHS
jgi:hypothetical protein